MSFFLFLGAFGVGCLAAYGWCMYRAGIQRGLEIAEGAPFTRRISMRRLVLFVALAMFLGVAATGQSAENAAAIAGVAGLLLPLALKFVPAAGHYMVAITLVASAIIAIAAEVASGEIVLSNLSATNGQALFVTALSVWGLSQIIYATLTQSPKTAPAVT